MTVSYTTDLTSQADFNSEDEYTDATGPLDGPCQPNATAGGTVPCIGKGHA